MQYPHAHKTLLLAVCCGRVLDRHRTDTRPCDFPAHVPGPRKWCAVCTTRDGGPRPRNTGGGEDFDGHIAVRRVAGYRHRETCSFCKYESLRRRPNAGLERVQAECILRERGKAVAIRVAEIGRVGVAERRELPL